MCLVLALAACDGEPLDVARAQTCDDLPPVGVELVERYLEALQGQPIAVLTGEAPTPPELAELDAAGADLDLRAAALGCDPVALNAAIVDGTRDLEATDPAGRLLLERVRGGVDATLPPSPVTEPPVTEPPVTEPPVTEPPVTEPATTSG